jgi:ribonuclease D
MAEPVVEYAFMSSRYLSSTGGTAVVVALHEAQHAAGWLSETQAQCRAMHYAKPLLTRLQWRAIQVSERQLPASYHDGSRCQL